MRVVQVTAPLITADKACPHPECIHGFHLHDTGTGPKSLAWATWRATWRAAGRPISPRDYERCPMSPQPVAHTQPCMVSDLEHCTCGASNV